MKPHSWLVEEVDGGTVGVCDFWHCTACGAVAGPVWTHRKEAPNRAFMGNGSGLALTQDCDESVRLIAAFNLGMECARRWEK